MDLDRARSEKKSLYYPTIVLSDTHLFKTVAQAELLLEFLTHTKCNTLILNGDIIDGWRMMAKKHKKFEEMHARVLDAINAKAAIGTNVVYIPGNHDEKLRAGWSKKTRKEIKDGQVRPAHPFLNRTHSFTDKDRSVTAPIYFANGYRHIDPAGRRILFLHGDQFDPARLKSNEGHKLSLAGDYVYDGLIRINGYAIRASRKILKKQFSIAAYLKKKTKKTLGIVESFEQAVAKSAKTGKIDGIGAGHIHHAEIREIKGVTYMNSGDWVESASALVHDEKGNWEIVHWNDKRKELGLDKLPSVDDPNEHAAYRGITERQLRVARRIWPAKDRKKLLKKLAKQHAEVADSEKAADRGRAGFEQDTAVARHTKAILGLQEMAAALRPV